MKSEVASNIFPSAMNSLWAEVLKSVWIRYPQASELLPLRFDSSLPVEHLRLPLHITWFNQIRSRVPTPGSKLQPTTIRYKPWVGPAGSPFFTQQGECSPWGPRRQLSKTVLERTSYGTWAAVGDLGKSSRKQGALLGLSGSGGVILWLHILTVTEQWG